MNLVHIYAQMDGWIFAIYATPGVLNIHLINKSGTQIWANLTGRRRIWLGGEESDWIVKRLGREDVAWLKNLNDLKMNI